MDATAVTLACGILLSTCLGEGLNAINASTGTLRPADVSGDVTSSKNATDDGGILRVNTPSLVLLHSSTDVTGHDVSVSNGSTDTESSSLFPRPGSENNAFGTGLIVVNDSINNNSPNSSTKTFPNLTSSAQETVTVGVNNFLQLPSDLAISVTHPTINNNNDSDDVGYSADGTSTHPGKKSPTDPDDHDQEEAPADKESGSHHEESGSHHEESGSHHEESGSHHEESGLAFARPGLPRGESVERVTVEALNASFSLCPGWSCRARCLLPVPAGASCQCDALCVLAGDCCIDFLLQCHDVRSVDHALAFAQETLNGTAPSKVSPALQSYVRDYSQCLDLYGRHVTVVTSCPVEFSDVTTRNDCHNATLTVPVSHAEEAGLVFRNRHCAACHGVTSEDVVTWVPRLLCPGVWDVESVEDVARVYRQGKCSTVYSLPKGVSAPRRCFPGDQNPRDTADIPPAQLVPGAGPCSPADAVFCRTFSLPLYISEDDDGGDWPPNLADRYANPFCLACSTGYRVHDFNSTSCPRDTSGQENLKPGNILSMFDLGSDGSSLYVDGRPVSFQDLCREDEAYSQADHTCRPVVCPSGYLPHRGRCELGSVMAADSQLLPSGWNVIHARMWLLESHGCTELFGDALNETTRRQVCSGSGGDDSYRRYAKMLGGWHYLEMALCSRDSNSSLSCSDDDLTLELVLSVAHTSTFTDFYHYYVRDFLDDIASAVGDIFANVTLSNSESFPGEIPGVCPVGERFVEDGVNMTELNDTLFVTSYKNAFAQYYPLENVVFAVSLGGPGFAQDEKDGGREVKDGGREVKDDSGPDSGDRVDRVVSAVLCDQLVSNSTLTCTAIRLPANGTRRNNGNLVVMATGRTYGPGQFQEHGDSVLVCLPPPGGAVWAGVELMAVTPAQQYVLHVLGAVSVLSLVLVLVVYRLLPDLRTLPGGMTQCLVGCMLVGHLALHLALPNPAVCRALAALSHFSWLAAFVWMTALAVHMATTFFHPTANQMSRSKAGAVFVRYSVVCWGLPLVLVAVCLALDLAPGVGVKVGYGQRSCGWLAEPEAIIFAFFLPLAVCLLLTLAAFLAAVYGIERVSRASRVATSRRSDGRRLLLYLRMSAALGFPWVLGFGVAFSDEEWLRWTFVVVNSLQGALIALAYLANRRVLGMLRERVAGVKARQGKTSSKSATQTTSVTDTFSKI